MEQLVLRTRRRLRLTTALSALAAGVAACVSWLLLSAVADLLMPLGVSARIVAFAVLLCLFAGIFVGGAAWFALRPMSMQHVAQRIEGALPNMHNRLVTVLDLAGNQGGRHAMDEGFARRLIDQTRSRLTDFRIEQVARTIWLRRLAAFCVAVVTVAALLTLLLFQRMPTAMARVLAPMAPIPPVTGIRIKPPGDLEVFEGDPLLMEVRVEDGYVETLTLRLINDEGSAFDHDMIRSDGLSFDYPIDRVLDSFRYQVLGGGTWTAPHQVTVLHRPILEKLAARVVLPSYMQISEAQGVADISEGISAPVGSVVVLDARVKGEVAKAQIQLFEPVVERVEDDVEIEAAWFDDLLPPDAELVGLWHWTENPVHSGTHSHTNSTLDEPYGFRTRLHKLSVAPSESFFVYVLLDAHRPPTQLRVTVTADPDIRHVLVWGEAAADQDTPTTDQQKVHARGDLPPAGRWVRLAVPATDLTGPESDAVLKIRGMDFQIDRGRAFFDRVGSLSTSVHKTEKVNMKPIATQPLEFDEQRGVWCGRIDVQSDLYFAVRFFNPSGYPSAFVKPWRIVATQDQPPKLVLERPDAVITLGEPEPVPILLRAFDDYGIRDASIEVRWPTGHVEPQELIESFDEPRRSRTLLTAIDPDQYMLGPGDSIDYTIIVRDFKGQEARSPTHKLALASPFDVPDQATVAEPLELHRLLRDVSSLVEIQNAVVETAGPLLRAVAPGRTVAVQTGKTVRLLNADGTALTTRQLNAILSEQRELLSGPARQRLAELQMQLAQQRRTMLALSQDMQAAAGRAEHTLLALPDEAWMLHDLADQLAGIAQRWEHGKAGLLGVAVTSPTIEQMESRLRQMLDARYMLPRDSALAQAQMERLMFDSRAQGAMHLMGELGEVLAAQQERLAQLRRRYDELGRRGRMANTSELDEVGARQRELDDEAIKQYMQLRALTQATTSATDFDQGSLMTAPWVPPGRRSTATPVEQDTPAQADAEPTAADRQQPDAANETDDWWDRPVDMGPPPVRAEQDPRFTDRARPVDASDDRQQRSATPREMLMRHQQEMLQHTAMAGNQLTQTMQAVDTMQKRMAQLLGDSNQKTFDASADAATSGQAWMLQDATQRMQQLLSSEQMLDLTGMADRAGALRRAMGDTAAQTSEPSKFTSAWSRSPRGGYVLSVDVENLDLSVAQHAALYRLPPKVRDPLIRGMKQRAPEGYQPLVDAYYRRLGSEEP